MDDDELLPGPGGAAALRGENAPSVGVRLMGELEGSHHFLVAST